MVRATRQPTMMMIIIIFMCRENHVGNIFIYRCIRMRAEWCTHCGHIIRVVLYVDTTIFSTNLEYKWKWIKSKTFRILRKMRWARAKPLPCIIVYALAKMIAINYAWSRAWPASINVYIDCIGGNIAVARLTHPLCSHLLASQSNIEFNQRGEPFEWGKHKSKSKH